MSHFDENALNKLMKLCRLECSAEEKQKFLHSVSRVVEYIDHLSEIPTEGVAPCNHILETIHNMTREDQTCPTLPRETFLSNAPSHVGGMIKVPVILKMTNS